MLKQAVVFAVAIVFVALFFSYRILDVPSGLTIDEASFGYNAVSIARTGTDQNGWSFPVFVLSINNKEWRQPVPQYYMALIFKLFGSSLFNLRFSSVIVTIVSASLLFILANKLFGWNGGLVTALVFLTTPQIMIQSHLGLDNITPVPFAVVWLLGIFLFSKTENKLYLLVAGIALGVGFYSYKGMRGVAPVWVILTMSYLIFSSWLKTKKKKLKAIFGTAFIFGIVVAPFFMVIPELEREHPCAVFGCQKLSSLSFYDFFYPYISSFDLSFLFIRGDETIYHSTGLHGMMLLSSLPLFLIGIYLAIKRRGFWMFVLIAFFTAPLLYGLVNSVHRASRLMVMIPPYSLLSGLGAVFLWERKKSFVGKVVLGAFGIIFLANYLDFINYYWFDYAKLTENEFGNFGGNTAFSKLAYESKHLELTPYMSTDVYDGSEGELKFFEMVHFTYPTLKIDPQEIPPLGSILLSRRKAIPGMKFLESPYRDYNLLRN